MLTFLALGLPVPDVTAWAAGLTYRQLRLAGCGGSTVLLPAPLS